VRFLLDENFPLGLIRALQADGLQADHIITLGLRGISDKQIRELLKDAQLVFFTQDDDFLFGEVVMAVVVLSRVRQSRPLKERIEVWRGASRHLTQAPTAERSFELTNEGVLVPWRDVPSRS
jgi:uncharacterized protein DUF5615